MSALTSLLLSFKQIATLTTGKLSPPYSEVTDIRKVNNPFVEYYCSQKTKAYICENRFLHYLNKGIRLCFVCCLFLIQSNVNFY